jgi:hypothetical protein
MILQGAAALTHCTLELRLSRTALRCSLAAAPATTVGTASLDEQLRAPTVDKRGDDVLHVRWGTGAEDASQSCAYTWGQRLQMVAAELGVGAHCRW